ncbi:uncharacterized protein [Gorilla gorilla gorilla]|uniref:uncharacterized protein isoform X3 n=1 Tax=Gorilla gorilla gorilla TaxID=9595 RepID=UPI002445C1B4|nr:uncharacterized protein LOC109027130 isoform X3 [Gorilla gorilla gorilla]
MPSEEGGARGSEIVKLCLGCARRRAVLALPWARARRVRVSRERVRAAASRVLVCARVPGAALPSYAQLRCAPPPARGSARAAWPLRLPGVLPAGGAGGCVREKARGAAGWERRESRREGGGEAGGRGAPRSSSQGRGAPARHGYSNPSTSRKRYFLRLGGFCILSSHRWGWRRPTIVILPPGQLADEVSDKPASDTCYKRLLSWPDDDPAEIYL